MTFYAKSVTKADCNQINPVDKTVYSATVKYSYTVKTVRNSEFLLLTFKKSLGEEEMMSAIYVCTSIGAAYSCSHVHLPVRQKPNLSTVFLNLFSKNDLNNFRLF
jgi:hypothetical protein